MKVQPSSPGIGQHAATSAGRVAPPGGIAGDSARGPADAAARKTAAPARRNDFAARQEHINRQVTHAQRTIAFLDQTLTHMQALKAVLSGSVARRTSTPSTLETSLAHVQQQWQARHAATGGALGPDLGFHDDGLAPQGFRIRALGLQALQQERAETLTVYPRGVGKPSLSLLVDGSHRSDREWARRIDHALAPAGISATVAGDRELAFSTHENRWPELREQLMIQGGGHRFPAGRPSRATAEAESPAIDPSRWQIANAAQQRTTLRHTVHAIDQLQNVREGLNRLLAQTSAAIRPHDDALSGAEARQIAAAFDAMLDQTNDFQRFTAIGAALRGLNDHRVRCVAGR